MAADLATFARSLAPHLPAAIALWSKDAASLPGIPDPSSALHGEQPSSSSHTPSSSSCLTSDNSAGWELGFSSGHNGAQTPYSMRSVSRSLGRGSGSLGRELPACPEGVVLQEHCAEWELDDQQEEQQRPLQETQAAAAGSGIQGDPDSLRASRRTDTGSPHSTNVQVQCGEFGSITILGSARGSPAPATAKNTRQEQIQPADDSNRSTDQHAPAWDDMKDRSPDLGPSAEENMSPAPAGFALFDSASSDPGGFSGGAPKDGSAKPQHSPAHSAVIAGSNQDSVQSAETDLVAPDKYGDIVNSAAEDHGSLLLHGDTHGICDTADDSDSNAPSAMPPKSGAQVAICGLSSIATLHSMLVHFSLWGNIRVLPKRGCRSCAYTYTAPKARAHAQARRARASRARAQARRRQLRAQEQQPEAGSSFRQWAGPGFARGGGNGSDSDSPKGNGAAPYRRRSPQHPFWLTFLDPALEAAFVAWQAQQQRKVSACWPKPCMEQCQLSTAL